MSSREAADVSVLDSLDSSTEDTGSEAEDSVFVSGAEEHPAIINADSSASAVSDLVFTLPPY